MDEETLRTDGWTAIDIEGFCRHISPIWTRGDIGAREVGLLVAPEHANAFKQSLYGGALVTFADAAFSISVGDAVGSPYSVTAHLQTQFVSAARVGEFLECRPEVVRQTRDLVFVRGMFKVGDKNVASADGIWKLVKADRS